MKKGTIGKVAVVAGVALAAYVLGRKSGAKSEAAALNALTPEALVAWKRDSQGGAQVLPVAILGAP